MELTNYFRQRLAQAAAGEAALPAAFEIAIGNGGHDPDFKPLPVDPDQAALTSEIDRRAAEIVRDGTEVYARVTYDRGELDGEVVSEAGLFDEAGGMMALENSAYKLMDATSEYSVEFVLSF